MFRLTCQLDLEGIVAKRADSPYEHNAGSLQWIRIKDRVYGRKEGTAQTYLSGEVDQTLYVAALSPQSP